jgi:hypothetical protein
MAITEVIRMSESVKGRLIPVSPEAMEGFPWAAACSMCPWSTSMGGWRDAFDFAFSHARGHYIEDLNKKHAEVAPTVTGIPVEEELEEFWRDNDEDDGDEPGTTYGRWGTE